MAEAAPWIQEEGALYTRAALVKEAVEGLHGYRGDVYLEYGWSEAWTVTLKGEAVGIPASLALIAKDGVPRRGAYSMIPTE